MEMNKTRTLIREQRLEKFARILSNRYNIELKLSPATHKIGCCDTTKKIWISSTIDENPIHNLLLQKATTLHEIGHILYTKNKAWEDMCVSPRFSNIISDGRVEEAISRLFFKARLYFIYINRKKNPVVIHKKEDKTLDINKMVYELVFREAKRNVGIPQLPLEIKVKLKKYLGNDYEWVLDKTRDCINAKTEDESAKIAYDLEMKIQFITKKECEIGEIDKSLDTCGAQSRQMPQMNEDSIVDKLEQLNKLEQEQIDNEIRAEDEKNKLEESLQQEPEITENVEKENYEPNEVEDVSIEEEMIDNFFDRKTSIESEEQDSEEVNASKSEDKEDLPGIDELTKQIEESINSIADQVEDRISKDAEDELRNENDTIQTGEVNPDFESYNTVETDDLKPTGKYGKFLRPVDITKLDPVARRISKQFKVIAQRGDGWIHNKTRGRLEMHKIHTVIDKNKRARIFRKKDEIESVDLGVVILLDASGSMNHRRFIATDTAYTISKALELGNYKSEVVQFGVEAGSTQVFGVKSFNQKTQYARKRFKPVAEGYTPLLEALQGAEKSLSNQDVKRKVCFVITDGYPYVTDVEKEVYREKCRKQLLKMEKQGITVIGLLIQAEDNRNIFNENRLMMCYDVSDVEKKMLDALKKVLIKLRRE